MSRESCIVHNPKQAIAIVRQDYYELMDRDACAAALLNIFEYWANAALAVDSSIERPWVGARPIREFEQMLLGIATDKQIRKRLTLLEEKGFIETRAPAKRGAAKAYRVQVPELQQAIAAQQIAAQQIESERLLWSHNRQPFGQITGEVSPARSNDLPSFGQITDAASVKRPTPLRSNDRALKKISKEFKLEKNKEAIFAFEPKLDSPVQASSQTTAKSDVSSQLGAISYAQAPEAIDLSELWERSPGIAKQQIRFLAPGHKRPEMVAHGVGHWWAGPGLNDFNEHLIQACQNRKRKFQQPSTASDAKTFINNMLRNGDWANFALRCEEALLLQERAATLPGACAVEPGAGSHSPFERSPAEKRESALGLARFKVARGDIKRAIDISEQFGLSRAEIGLTNAKTLAVLSLKAA